MELIDNITHLWGDDLTTLKPKARLKIAASCFSIYTAQQRSEQKEQCPKYGCKS